MAFIHKFTLFADYFQIHLLDASSSDDLSAIWTEEAFSQMLAVGQSALCLGTLRNINVDVELHLSDSNVTIDPSKHDHIVEASFTLPTGKLVVMGCTDFLPGASHIDLQAGTYQVLYAVSGVDTIKTESEPAEDKYSIYLWPGDLRASKLIKYWKKEDASKA